ncbi:MAG: phospho-N-acetylmuramoyl-pentapeptide-transferase [Clostridia bacterium]|nr:phospho-N-acetylmuramoyl-pentapeptide-transferase [Clostridia bacterium]
MLLQAEIFMPLALLLGFGVSALAGRVILPMLQRSRTGQQVREVGPSTHLKKSGTPTFGGFIFLSAFTLLTLIYLVFRFNSTVLLILLFTLVHGAIGYWDDFVKVRKDKKGISAKQKTIALLLVEAIFIAIYLFGMNEEIRMVWPFGWGVLVIAGWGKLLYGLFLLFYFYACTNAVNITDGVDGLASSITIVVLLFTGITALLGYNSVVAEGAGILSFLMAGALLGFLLYNWHKAKVFMGDTGSLALGALVSALFLAEQIPWAFVLSGAIYVIDILSVFIQVTYFRHTGGKRIFRMSPIHHHFELGGWSEYKVVTVFVLVTLAGSVCAALSHWPWLAR